MYELYSARLKNAKGEPEVFVYDNFPESFRNQVFFILTDYMDQISSISEDRRSVWKFLHDSYCREKGIKNMRLGSTVYYATEEDYIETYISKSSSEDFLDFIDYVFSSISNKEFCNQVQQISYHYSPKQAATEAIYDLNQRFKQHSLGYYFEGQLIRIDNSLIHNEFVKPALQLLSLKEFEGADAEYRSAFNNRKNGDNKNAIINAAKSFESVMKTICDQENYPYDPQKDTAKKLIDILKNNDFFPDYLGSHLNAICNTLENGAPNVRNKESGHGQGSEIKEVPNCLVDYTLGLVAVNIVLLVNLYKAKEHKQ